MTFDRIFSLCMAAAAIGWLALILAPLARTQLIAAARVIAVALALAYFIQLFTITQPVAGASFSTLAGVTALFSLPGNVMLGWTHYLAFDLLVGSWEVEDSAKIGLPHWAIFVPLALTFMFGPIGLFTYAVIRMIHMWRRHGRLML
jgi:Domain of unknown function (DUF4281)